VFDFYRRRADALSEKQKKAAAVKRCLPEKGNGWRSAHRANLIIFVLYYYF
jgi:hypothetical protein